jgi:replicative DNA helicase
MNAADLGVLKGITSDKVSGITFAHSFDHTLFSPEYSTFGKLCIDYLKAFRDVPTRRTLTERHHPNIDTVGLINKVWDELDNFDYNQHEFNYDLTKLKKRYQKSAVNKIRARAEQEGSVEDPGAFFKDLALRIQDVARLDLARGFTQMPAGDYIEEFAERYEARRLHPEQAPEVNTGYSLIDLVTGGLAPAELIMVGAESNGGKSMLLSNMAIQLWMQDNDISMKSGFRKGYNILYFSLEMPYEDCFVRFLGRVANVPQRSLTSSSLDKRQDESVKKAYEFIKLYQEAGYYFDIVDVPRGATIEEIELRYNDALLKYRPDIVVVDYMGLMHNEAFAKEQDWLRMGAIAASLHEFARAYGVVVITAAQLTDIKRDSKSKTSEEYKRVGMHRWGRSSLIMHHVNLGIQIETRPGERNFPDMKYHVVKNRKGPLGVGNMIKNFANASLIDVPCSKDNQGDISPEDIPSLIEKVQTRTDDEEE